MPFSAPLNRPGTGPERIDTLAALMDVGVTPTSVAPPLPPAGAAFEPAALLGPAALPPAAPVAPPVAPLAPLAAAAEPLSPPLPSTPARFSLPALPPGEYDLRLWHPRYGERRWHVVLPRRGVELQLSM